MPTCLVLDVLKTMSPVEVLPTHTPELFERAALRAAELLRAGDVVALPTETVYGLAANALDPAAVERIYQVKGRPPTNPVIVHVNSHQMAARCCKQWPEHARSLARAFWPGPLTIVVERAEEIPDVVTAGGGTVGVRWPAHPFIRAVIESCGFPLAAPSANRSNQLSPTNASHVRDQLGPEIRLIVDGGQSQVGIESTVVDATVDPPIILRPGMIHEEAILAVTGALQQGGESRGPRRSPGMLLKHYAPEARLLILSWLSEGDLHRKLEALSVPFEGTHIITHTRIPTGGEFEAVSVIPHDPEAYARALYAELHRCDAAGARTIVVETVPDTPEWGGISDRLRRAASPRN